MNTVLLLVKKNFMGFINDRPALILTFVVPAVLILIFGNIFGGGSSPRGKQPVIFVNKSGSEISKLIEKKLEESKEIYLVKTFHDENRGGEIPFDEETAKNYVREGKISSALVLPEDSFADTSSALKLKFYYDPKNEIEYSILQGTIQKTIMTEIPSIFPLLMKRKVKNLLGNDSTKTFFKSVSNLMGNYFDISADSLFDKMTSGNVSDAINDTSKAKNMMDSIIKIESEQLVGNEISNPGVTRIVGGWAVMFLMFSLTGIITAFFEEKSTGCIKRLLCSPVKRSHILWGKFIFALLVGAVQLLVLFILSWLFFGVDIFSNFGNLLIVVIMSSGAAVSFGMFITAVAKTQSQASGLATLLILTMSALGGAWFPVSLLPEWMQTISKLTITYWSIEAFLQVLWRGADFSGIAFDVLILFSIAFIVNYYSFIRFRKGRVI